MKLIKLSIYRNRKLIKLYLQKYETNIIGK